MIFSLAVRVEVEHGAVTFTDDCLTATDEERVFICFYFLSVGLCNSKTTNFIEEMCLMLSKTQYVLVYSFC